MIVLFVVQVQFAYFLIYVINKCDCNKHNLNLLTSMWKPLYGNHGGEIPIWKPWCRTPHQKLYSSECLVSQAKQTQRHLNYSLTNELKLHWSVSHRSKRVSGCLNCSYIGIGTSYSMIKCSSITKGYKEVTSPFWDLQGLVILCSILKFKKSSKDTEFLCVEICII